MSQTTKTYIKGSAKEVTFDQGGRLINFSVNVNQLKELANERGYVNLTLRDRRDEDDYGNNMYIVLNDYKPKTKEGSHAATPTQAKKEPTPVQDDLPF